MDLRTEYLQAYVGSQVEVEDMRSSILNRGEITAIDIRNNTLFIRLAWWEQGKPFPGTPHSWEIVDIDQYMCVLDGANIVASGATLRINFGRHLVITLFASDSPYLIPKPEAAVHNPYPEAYNGCDCECHYSDVVHIGPCCEPESGYQPAFDMKKMV